MTRGVEARIRDVLAHQYFRVQATTVRDTLDSPLDDLVQACEQYLNGEHGR